MKKKSVNNATVEEFMIGDKDVSIPITSRRYGDTDKDTEFEISNRRR